MSQASTDITPNGSLGILRSARALVTDAMVIAAATAFAYFATFIYELGFCYHFDLPASLINPNVSTILVAACALCGVLVTSANWLGFVAPLIHAAGDPKQASYRPIYLYLAIASIGGIFMTKIYDFGWRGMLSFTAGALILGMALFGQTLLFNRKVPFRERLDNDMATQRNDPFRFDLLLELWLHPRAVNYLYILAVFLGLAWMMGNGNANTQSRFLTLREAPDSVVLRNYGDLLIVAKFSRETKHLSNELSLLWLSEKKQLDLRNEFVGPLSLPPGWGKDKPSPAVPPTPAAAPTPIPNAVTSPNATPAPASAQASAQAPTAPASSAAPLTSAQRILDTRASGRNQGG